jgi:hypothetical protein
MEEDVLKLFKESGKILILKNTVVSMYSLFYALTILLKSEREVYTFFCGQIDTEPPDPTR